jgi:hypothetical protein
MLFGPACVGTPHPPAPTGTEATAGGDAGHNDQRSSARDGAFKHLNFLAVPGFSDSKRRSDGTAQDLVDSECEGVSAVPFARQ